MVCQMDRGKPWELIQKPLVPLLRKKLLVAFVDGSYLQRESFEEYEKNIHETVRGSHQRYPIKKGVHRNFIKFTGKHLCQSLFLKFLRNLFYRTPPDDCFMKQ